MGEGKKEGIDVADLVSMDSPHLKNHSDPIDYKQLVDGLDAAHAKALLILKADLEIDKA